jgi:hypothetical protein
MLQVLGGNLTRPQLKKKLNKAAGSGTLLFPPEDPNDKRTRKGEAEPREIGSPLRFSPANARLSWR